MTPKDIKFYLNKHSVQKLDVGSEDGKKSLVAAVQQLEACKVMLIALQAFVAHNKGATSANIQKSQRLLYSKIARICFGVPIAIKSSSTSK